jgi:hypothetical protein
MNGKKKFLFIFPGVFTLLLKLFKIINVSTINGKDGEDYNEEDNKVDRKNDEDNYEEDNEDDGLFDVHPVSLKSKISLHLYNVLGLILF